METTTELKEIVEKYRKQAAVTSELKQKFKIVFLSFSLVYGV